MYAYIRYEDDKSRKYIVPTTRIKGFDPENWNTTEYYEVWWEPKEDCTMKGPAGLYWAQILLVRETELELQTRIKRGARIHLPKLPPREETCSAIDMLQQNKRKAAEKEKELAKEKKRKMEATSEKQLTTILSKSLKNIPTAPFSEWDDDSSTETCMLEQDKQKAAEKEKELAKEKNRKMEATSFLSKRLKNTPKAPISEWNDDSSTDIGSGAEDIFESGSHAANETLLPCAQQRQNLEKVASLELFDDDSGECNEEALIPAPLIKHYRETLKENVRLKKLNYNLQMALTTKLMRLDSATQDYVTNSNGHLLPMSKNVGQPGTSSTYWRQQSVLDDLQSQTLSGISQDTQIIPEVLVDYDAQTSAQKCTEVQPSVTIANVSNVTPVQWNDFVPSFQPPGLVDLGGISISTTQWNKVIMAKNTSLFGKELALCLWHPDVLQERTVKGVACNAKSGKETGDKRPELTPIKKQAIYNAIGWYLRSKGQQSPDQGPTIIMANKILNQKIQDLRKAKKPQVSKSRQQDGNGQQTAPS